MEDVTLFKKSRGVLNDTTEVNKYFTGEKCDFNQGMGRCLNPNPRIFKQLRWQIFSWGKTEKSVCVLEDTNSFFFFNLSHIRGSLLGPNYSLLQSITKVSSSA